METDLEAHKRIARRTIERHPEKAKRGEWYTLVRIAQKDTPERDLSQFLLAKLMGEIHRGEIS